MTSSMAAHARRPAQPHTSAAAEAPHPAATSNAAAAALICEGWEGQGRAEAGPDSEERPSQGTARSSSPAARATIRHKATAARLCGRELGARGMRMPGEEGPMQKGFRRASGPAAASACVCCLGVIQACSASRSVRRGLSSRSAFQHCLPHHSHHHNRTKLTRKSTHQPNLLVLH